MVLEPLGRAEQGVDASSCRRRLMNLIALVELGNLTVPAENLALVLFEGPTPTLLQIERLAARQKRFQGSL